MNHKLANRLYDKWSSPENRPAKGAAVVDKCSPCAQTEALMLHANCDVKGVKDILDRAAYEAMASRGNPPSLDHEVAKALGISDIHAVLLRRFNDFSTENPAIVLKNPEKVLGPNCRKVLNFWKFLDTLTPDEWVNLHNKLKSYDPSVLGKQGLGRKFEVSGVITPDLYYPKFGTNQEPKKIESEGDERILMRSFNTWDGGLPKSAYFSWVSAWDACISSGISDLECTIPTAVACATLEIQCVGNSLHRKDLYFCKALGYDPYNPLPRVYRNAKKWFASVVRGNHGGSSTDGLVSSEPKNAFRYVMGESVSSASMRRTQEEVEKVKEAMQSRYRGPLFIPGIWKKLTNPANDTPVGTEGGVPILTLRDTRNFTACLDETTLFFRMVKNLGHNSFILGLPKEAEIAEQSMEAISNETLISMMESYGCTAERLGDSKIPAAPGKRGMSCWKFSW